MPCSITLNGRTNRFADLKALPAKATPARSGDALARIAAENEEERTPARRTRADVPLARFLEDLLIPDENDDVTRLIMDTDNAQTFSSPDSIGVDLTRDISLR